MVVTEEEKTAAYMMIINIAMKQDKSLIGVMSKYAYDMLRASYVFPN